MRSLLVLAPLGVAAISMCCASVEELPTEALTSLAKDAELASFEPERCGMAFDPEPELADATRVAAERWSAATACDVRVAHGGVPVRIASAAERGGHQAAAVRNRITGEWFVGVAPGLLPWTAETLLAHELGHVLGCLEHTPDGLMAETFELYTPIDESDLACVCAAFACVEFIPEL